ncbi:MAG TPA: hypothetical protein VFJ18_03815 [Pararhizobium sp.]|jgi:hypothetical protein|nr:hypothetical protein [Pararhizobium sp.]
MTDSKPWYLSKTLWGAAVAVAASLAGLAGIDITGADQTTIADSALQIASAAGALVAIFGRLAASHKLF